MTRFKKNSLILISMLAFVIISKVSFSAQYAGSEIIPDGNTVILDHLNGSTSGELVGELNYVPSVSGLDVAGDFVTGNFVIYPASNTLVSQGTIELWLYPREYQSLLVDFNWYKTYSYPSHGHVLQLALTDVGKIRLGNWNSNPACPSLQLYSNSTIPLNEWSHVAVSWGTETKIYINGEVDVSTAQCFSPPSPKWVYLHEWGTDDLGYVDEFHVSDTQRTDDEIRSRVTPLVNLDIKPGSDPNCFNINDHGVIPVSILGSPEFDVTAIDMTSLLFSGLEVRVRGNKNPSCSIEDTNADGYDDMVCKFIDDSSNWSAGDSDSATLIGTLLDGTEFEGTDSICIVP
jgi:hypothetical protein